MAYFSIKPMAADRRIANAIVRRTSPPVEEIARLLTWGADEKILIAVAIGGWVCASRKPHDRKLADHFLAISLASAILPHLLKAGVDQTRPDRLTVRGHLRGIPISGRARDAFPSGHAVHMGALASAAGLLPPPARPALRALAFALSATRVVLLAHWASDVAAGFALGTLLERIVRYFTLRRPTQS
jgi:undecaprenyl-diphosphatase